MIERPERGVGRREKKERGIEERPGLKHLDSISNIQFNESGRSGDPIKF
jgi:hypothetical protein